MSLKVRRGLEIDRLSITPDSGELLFVTDTLLLYIGDGSTPGGIPVDGGGVSPYIILRSTGIDAHRWKFTADDSGMLSQPGEDLGV